MKALIAILALSGAANDESLPLQMESEYAPHSKIAIGCNCTIPEGGKVDCSWSFEPAVEYERVGEPKGCVVHVWAKPGTYKVTAQIIIKKDILAVTGYDENKKPIIEPLEVIVDWQLKEGAFTVGVPPPPPDPTPPGPTPPSGDFADKIAAAAQKVPKADRDKQIEYTQGDGHKTSKPAKFAIAEIYEDTGSEALRNPTAWTAARMRADLDQKLSTLPATTLAAWRPFFVDEQKAWREENLDQSDTKGHAERYLIISEVLQAQ